MGEIGVGTVGLSIAGGKPVDEEENESESQPNDEEEK